MGSAFDGRVTLGWDARAESVHVCHALRRLLCLARRFLFLLFLRCLLVQSQFLTCSRRRACAHTHGGAPQPGRVYVWERWRVLCETAARPFHFALNLLNFVSEPVQTLSFRALTERSVSRTHRTLTTSMSSAAAAAAPAGDPTSIGVIYVEFRGDNVSFVVFPPSADPCPLLCPNAPSNETDGAA